MLEAAGLTERENTVVVIVDIQEKLFPFIHNKEKLLGSVLKTVDFCRRLEIPILVTEQYPKGLGATLPELQDVLAGSYKPMAKTIFSCFGSPEFVDALDEANAETIVLAGIETHICVMQTALGGLAGEDLDVVVLADCVGSRAEENHALGLGRMRDEGAVISSSEMFFYEMLVAAKTEDHKKVFDLLK